jgi:hypothetical protein
MSCGNEYACRKCQVSYFEKNLIHTSERRPAPIRNGISAFGKGLTIQLLDEKPRRMACIAKIAVARYFGRRYTASRYTFSPPERGYMVPNSSQIKSPQNESKKPATQTNKDAPTDPTDPRIVDGAENMPVPIILPMLGTDLVRKARKIARKGLIHEHCAAKYTQVATHSPGCV